MKKIVVLCKGQLEIFPPVMTVARVVRELGMEVTVICSFSNDSTKADFKALGITILDVYPGYSKAVSLPAKVTHWRRFRVEAWKAIDKLGDIDLLWVGSVDGALALGKPLLRRRFVLHALELYDKHWMYRRLMKRYVKRAAAVVVCEHTRACIFRCWYDLKETPFILPNKPINHPLQPNLEIEDGYAREILTELGENKRIVLFQGVISFARDVRAVAEAVRTMGDGWRFVVMGPGKKNYLEVLHESYPEVVHIPRVIAPYHLQITSHSHIGVVTYSYDCLNHLFCAPNKVWESAGFGLPMICGDLPALQTMVEANGAGICVNMEDSTQIASALREIDDNYESFSQNSRKLYDSVDIHGIIRNIVDSAGLHG